MDGLRPATVEGARQPQPLVKRGDLDARARGDESLERFWKNIATK